MHRNKLIELLEDYQQRFPNEKAICSEFLDFVKSNENCFDRELEIGHITASAFLLNPSKDKILLTHHKKLNMWLQPGGHADGESDVHNVAFSEAEEESGLPDLQILDQSILDIDIHDIPARKTEPAHKHYDLRLIIHSPNSEDYIVSDESHDLAWADLAKLEKWTTEHSILRMRDKYLKL